MAFSPQPPSCRPGEAVVALRRLRDETERRGAVYRAALRSARPVRTMGDAAQLLSAVQRYALAAEELDSLCVAVHEECGITAEDLVAYAITAPGCEVVSDAALAKAAEQL